MDESASDKEAEEDDEQLQEEALEEYDIIEDIDYEKLNTEIATNIDENQDNLDEPCTSTYQQQSLTKFDILHR